MAALNAMGSPGTPCASPPAIERQRRTFWMVTATVNFDPDKADVATLVKATTNAGFPSAPRH